MLCCAVLCCAVICHPMPCEDLFRDGLDLVPHGAPEERYRLILQGRFRAALRGVEALQYDLDEEAEPRLGGIGPMVADPAAAADDAEQEIDWIAALEEELSMQDLLEEIAAADDFPEDPALPPPPPPPPPPAPGAIVAAEPLEAALQAGRWGVFTITPKQVGHGLPYGGWQARCIFHRPGKSEHGTAVRIS
jgi:hypothetical protein